MSPILQILVVEDDEVDWLALSRRFRELSDRFALRHAARVTAAAELLASERFDCALLDVNLPDGSGMDLLESLDGTAAIVMTGRGEASIAVDAMKRGAADFVEKQNTGEHLTILPELIERAYRQKSAEKELIQYRNGLEVMVKERTRDLEEEVERRVRIETDLKALLEVKETLLQEVHHRVKNNLQVVSSLLGLQSETAETPAARDLLSASTRRIQAMALVHEQIYQSSSLSDVNLVDYLRELAVLVSDGYNSASVDLRIESEEIHVPLDTIIPVGLIATELLSNAYKYAFPDEHESPRITLSARVQSSGELELTIADNGRGIPQEVVDGQTDSLGLSIVRVLTDQLHGSVTSQSEGGTSWTLVIPLP